LPFFIFYRQVFFFLFFPGLLISEIIAAFALLAHTLHGKNRYLLINNY